MLSNAVFPALSCSRPAGQSDRIWDRRSRPVSAPLPHLLPRCPQCTASPSLFQIFPFDGGTADGIQLPSRHSGCTTVHGI